MNPATTEPRDAGASGLLRMAIWVVGISMMGRLFFLGLIDLLPQEAYYWNYAEHLDIGYLDHPPLSAWLIWLSTSLVGDSELGVRLPAFLSWIVMAVYMYRLAYDLFGRKSALACTILLAVLPIYWSVGFLMTPDAPLYAAWAATLFYARRAMVDKKPTAWIGVGLAMGWGLLSKYTMVLLGGAIIVFLLVDSNARRCLTTPGPYLALLLSVALFLPVLVWNYQNGWLSFAFQGTRRWSFPPDFHLHILVASALTLLTPIGLWESAKAIFRLGEARRTAAERNGSTARNAHWALMLCGLPLSVFVVHSLANQTKLNWTGPVWLAVLPWVAHSMIERRSRCSRRVLSPLKGAWAATIAAGVVLIPVGLSWILVGAPGFRGESWYKLPVAWEEFGRAVEALELKVEAETGHEPLIVGVDQYWVASEASFYDVPGVDSLNEFAGRGVIGRGDLMWSRWIQPRDLAARTMLLVGLKATEVDQPSVHRSFANLGPVMTENINRNSRQVGRFYWRLASSHRLRRPHHPDSPTLSAAPAPNRVESELGAPVGKTLIVK